MDKRIINMRVTLQLAYPDFKSTGSIIVIVNLRKGDVVSLRHMVSASNEGIQGNRYSEFIGHIL